MLYLCGTLAGGVRVGVPKPGKQQTYRFTVEGDNGETMFFMAQRSPAKRGTTVMLRVEPSVRKAADGRLVDEITLWLARDDAAADTTPIPGFDDEEPAPAVAPVEAAPARNGRAPEPVPAQS